MKKFLLKFTYLLSSPYGQICMEFCTAVGVVDIITCDNFFGNHLKGVDSIRS